MRPEFASAQRGFGLVAALFLIIVIAGVIAAMSRLAVAQHGTSSLALQQARAYQAARAGLEWGIHRVVKHPKGCPAETQRFFIGAFGVAVTFNAGDLHSGFCTLSAVAEYSTPGSPDYIHRHLQAVLEEETP